MCENPLSHQNLIVTLKALSGSVAVWIAWEICSNGNFWVMIDSRFHFPLAMISMTSHTSLFCRLPGGLYHDSEALGGTGCVEGEEKIAQIIQNIIPAVWKEPVPFSMDEFV